MSSLPSNFVVTNTPYLQVNLTWHVTDNSEQWVEIWRAGNTGSPPPDGDFVKIDQTDRSDNNGSTNLLPPYPSPSIYMDDTVAANTTYWYRIRSNHSSTGFSAYTSKLSVTTSNPAATPVANISVATQTQTKLLGEPVEFNGEGSTGYYECEWNFGDNKGIYSIARNLLKPVHLYRATGNYTVTLKVWNSAGTLSQTSTTVQINDIPSPVALNTVDMSDPSAYGGSYYISNLTDGPGNLTKFINAWEYLRVRSGTKKIVIPNQAQLHISTQPVFSILSDATYLTVTGQQSFTRDKRCTLSEMNNMPQFIMTANGSFFGLYNTAHHVRFQGIKFTQSAGTSTAGVNWYLQLGNETETSIAQVSHHFIIEHCAFICPAAKQTRRGLLAEVFDLSVADSVFEDFKLNADSQAICVNTGDRGAIINCKLEGSAENIILGGFAPGYWQTPPYVAIPSGYTFRRNWFHKPLKWFPGNANNPNGTWDGGLYTVKNSFELKCGLNVIVAGNFFERYWSKDQQQMIVFRGGSDTGNGQTNNVWYAYNRHKQGAQSIYVIGQENGPRAVRRVTVEHNVFEEFDASKWWYSSPNTDQLARVRLGGPDFTFRHNTWAKPGEWRITFYFDASGRIWRRFRFTDNIHYDQLGNSQGYYVYMQGIGAAQFSSSIFSPAAVYLKNVLAVPTQGPMPANNFYPTFTSLASIFTDHAGGVYSLAPGSPYAGQALDTTGGTDIGVNWTDYSAAVLNTTVGDWTAPGGGDTTPPTGSITSPTAGQNVSGTISVTASASDDVAVAGVQFYRDSGTAIGSEDTSSPYSVSLDTTGLSNGSHTVYAVIRDTSNNTFQTASVSFTVNNNPEVTTSNVRLFIKVI